VGVNPLNKIGKCTKDLQKIITTPYTIKYAIWEGQLNFSGAIRLGPSGIGKLVFRNWRMEMSFV